MNMSFLSFILIVFGIPVVLGIIIGVISSVQKKKHIAKIKEFANEAFELSPKEFFAMRNKSAGGRGKKHISTDEEFTGVYIIHNVTKDMYYVGQSKKILQRVNQHFTGHGNGDVYADYKNGNEFTIKTVSLSNSEYSSLDTLERDLIEAYEAKKNGYNKTKGNR